MRTPYTVLLAGLLPLASLAQTQNALDFDGTGDQVTVPNASALIANSTGFSITCWVKPSSGTTHDGIVGLRDETVADFYLLKLQNSNSVEGRMRNSLGTAFTINYPSLVMNTWQHLALVYDGSALILYHNGTQVSTTPASGTITSTTGTLRLGNLEYNLDNFYLDGVLDEVSLWNRALTAVELDCISQSGINVATSGLQLYYKMDQGVAGGNNTAITTLTDAMGNGNGTFNAFTLTGAGSNFVGGATLGTTINEQVCPGDSTTFDGQVITQPGSYTATYTTGGTCDSVVTLVLSFTNVSTNVIQNGATLVSQAVGAQYQWLDCGNNYAEVVGATGASYVATTSGSYAVEVTQNGCVDTSACYTVSTIGLAEQMTGPVLAVYPDPVENELWVELDAQAANITVLDAAGRVVSAQRAQGRRTRLAADALASGMYFLRVESDGRLGVVRFVKR
ncbi:MAG: T9SS type A sorting domain-containing protein [Flavobacteriales bacterium]|nr:T9SS type A sorting domain-containing protein [Flavobacteriales bacterium]